MLSWLTSLSSSVLLYIIAALLASTVLFGGLLYHELGKISTVESELGVAQQANKSLDNSLTLKIQSCDATDAALAQYQKDKDVVSDNTNTKLSAIDSLPSIKKPVKATTQATQNVQTQDETDVVDIDGKLPASLISLLQQSSSAVKGSVTNNP